MFVPLQQIHVFSPFRSSAGSVAVRKECVSPFVCGLLDLFEESGKMPAAPAEAAPQGTEHVVEETIRDLKAIPGFQSYLILNNDGIVIKYENMSYRTAVHYAHQVLGLASKASKYIRELFDAPDNEVECIRMRTVQCELMIAQMGNFTIVCTHAKIEEEVEVVKEGEGEKKEGEEKKE